MGQGGSGLGWAGLRALPGPAEGKAAPAVLGWKHKLCWEQLDRPLDEAVYFYFGQEVWSISPTP